MSERHANALPGGHRLQDYRIERVLGEGGFGITYLATDEVLGKVLAIKEYLPFDVAVRSDNLAVSARSEASRDLFAWGLERFLDEARRLVPFQEHPNVVRVERYFEAQGTAYMVMAFQEGESLGEILGREGTLTEDHIADILWPLLDGLEAVHKTDLLHRDIKPDNIFIRRDGTPVLLDFGAAREALGQRSRSMTGIVADGYSPLEQYSSEGGLQGPWTDLYALGATLYRAITGDRPSPAPDRIMGDTLVAAAERVGDDYDGDFLGAIDWALTVLPQDRPQTVASFREAVFGPDEHKVINEPARAIPTQPPPPPSPPTDDPEARRRARGLLSENNARARLEAVLEEHHWSGEGGGGKVRALFGDDAAPVLAAHFEAADDDGRAAIVRVLEDLADSRGLGTLIAALEDAESPVRWHAAEALGALGDPRALDALLAALARSTDDDYMRRFLVKGFAGIRNANSVAALVSLLDDDHYEVRENVVEALDGFGWQPGNEQDRARFLVCAKRYEDARPCGAAAVAPLSRQLLIHGERDDKQRALTVLVNILEHAADQASDDDLRLTAALPDVDSIYWDTVYDSCDNPSQEIFHAEVSCADARQLARQALLKRDLGERPVAELFADLASELPNLREMAIADLAEIGDESAIAALVETALEDDDPRVRESAQDALDIHSEISVGLLIEALRSPDFDRRRGAADTLANFHHRRTLTGLSVALDDKDEMIREIAFEGVLTFPGDEDAIGPLVKALDLRTQLRRQAIDALVESGERAVPALVQALGGTAPRAVYSAALALGRIGDARAAGPLLHLADDPRFARGGVEALHGILEVDAPNIPDDVLIGLTRLAGLVQSALRDGEDAYPVDCGAVNELARAEQLRRQRTG